MKKRPGFVTATGIVVAVVVLLCVLAVGVLAGPGMFSPGALNAQTSAGPQATTGASTLGGVSSHAQLGDDCGACHPAPWSRATMADKCLGCHGDVTKEIAAGNGLHGHMKGMQASPTCSGCHPEHGGPHGALTALDEGSFGSAHDVTGFSLKSHRKTDSGGAFTCRDCHPRSWSPFDQAICADCHARIDAAFMKEHEAAFGKDCLPCHDGSGNASVDHSKFAFKLTGKHAGVACDACHKGATSMQDYKQTPQDCYSCHAQDDEHKGSFGQSCEDCHTAAGWGDTTFDHAVFPLDHGSEEQKATCKTCHPQTTKTYTCFGCHAHTTSNVVNEHEGKSLAQLTDCVKCHAGGRGGGD